MAQDLAREGWQVDVLAPHAPGAARYETLSGIEVRRFRYLLPESQQTVCYEGGALINLRQKKSNWLKLPFLAISELLVTLRMLSTRRYAIVNAHWILPQGFVAAIAGVLTRTPLVITVHGGDVFDLKGGLLSKFKRWSLRRAAVVTTNSTATHAATAALAPAGEIHTIPMGVTVSASPDPDLVAGLRDQYRRGAGPMLVFVGRLVIEKGVDDLLRAVAMLKSELPDTTVVVVGTGQDQDELRALCTSLSLDDRVTFAGWIEPAGVPAYMTAADIFVGLSKQSASGWREGLGLVFLEAMAAQTPVVATRSGGIPDIVVHEETGLLVSENAPAQAAAAIERLHADPELAVRLATQGSELARNTYSRQASAAAFAGVFDQLSKS
jgi:glycosyltransferase involved in cell wall biosynthesis